MNTNRITINIVQVGLTHNPEHWLIHVRFPYASRIYGILSETDEFFSDLIDTRKEAEIQVNWLESHRGWLATAWVEANLDLLSSFMKDAKSFALDAIDREENDRHTHEIVTNSYPAGLDAAPTPHVAPFNPDDTTRDT